MNSIQQIDFLAAKVYPQRVLGELIERSGVLESLSGQQRYPKVRILIAPAGYGKSTLLYQLMSKLQADSEVVSWLSLDENDNNLSVFSSYLLHSLSVASDAIDEFDFSQVSAAAQNANPREKLMLLFNAIAAQKQIITMILDDFHLISNPRLLAFFDWMIEVMPPNLAFVIGSRTLPDLKSIPDLRAKSNFIEIGGSQLQFSLAECRAFFTRSVGVDGGFELDDELLDLLHKKTEGWVAAMQMALLALRNHPNAKEFIREFSGTDRDIVGYLANTVVAHLNAETRDFLMRTSVLERMNGELCNLLTNSNDAEKTIVALERAGMFLFAIDRARNWYRYHHLFRDYLRNELRVNDVQLYCQLCRLAAEWFEQSGRIDEAVEYYLHATDYQRASGLIAQRASSVVQYQGQHETLLSWLTELPESYICSYPEILVNYLWSLLFTRDFNKAGQAMPWLHQLEPKDTGKADYLNYSEGMLQCIREVLGGRQQSARLMCDQWLERWPQAPSFERGTVLGCLGAACLHTMEYRLARRALTEGSREFHECGAEYGVAWMDSIFALSCMRQGFVQEAKAVLENSLRRSTEKMGEYSFSSAMLGLGLGYVCYELNELQRAELLIDKGFLYIEEHGLADNTIAGYFTKARLLVRQGEFEAGLETLRTGERFGREQGIANFEFALMLERGRLLINQGRKDAALSIRGDLVNANEQVLLVGLSAYEELLLELYLIRINIMLGESARAVERSKLLIKKCQHESCYSLLVIGLILNARALSDCDEKLKATRSLEKAISLASGEAWLSIFIDEREHVLELLPVLQKGYRLKASEKELNQEEQFVVDLCTVMNLEQEPPEKPESVTESIIESLTKRERQILGLLKQGLSNQQLADSLFVSLSTIKWHLSNIYGKLGVKNKMQAIRVLGSLPED